MADIEINIPKNNKNSKTYVYMFRTIDDSYMYKDYACQALFLYLLRKANRFETKFRGEILPPGSIRRSTKTILDDLGMSKYVFFRCLNKLQSQDGIKTKRGRSGISINICNYLEYQCIETVQQDEVKTKSVQSQDGPCAHNKKERIKERKKERIKEGSPRPSSGVPIWDAYASEFEKRFQRKPLRNAAVNSMCKKIAETVGQEDGQLLVRFYVNHPKQFYALKGYDLRYLLGDMQALYGEMKEGRPRVATYEPPKRPIDIGPAMSYREPVVEDCPKCQNQGLLQKLDNKGVAYRCSCVWFIKKGYKRVDYQEDPDYVAAREARRNSAKTL